MDALAEQQLLTELQELYLENKEWLSEVRFLEDELRFFGKLFDQVLSAAIRQEHILAVQPTGKQLEELDVKRKELKDLILKNQHLLESLIGNRKQPLGLELITEQARITTGIRALLDEEKCLRRALYAVAENILDEERTTHLLN